MSLELSNLTKENLRFLRGSFNNIEFTATRQPNFFYGAVFTIMELHVGKLTIIIQLRLAYTAGKIWVRIL